LMGVKHWFLLTPRSPNRANCATSAPIAPACSGRSRWWERGGSFRHVGFVGFMSGFPASGFDVGFAGFMSGFA
jgi:hypothetical protein